MDIVDILQGSLSLIYVIISFIIGFSIFSKFRKIKNRLYILVGIFWLMLSTLWLPEAISFLMSVFGQGTLVKEWYFFIGNVFIPIAVIAWIIAYTDMISKDKQNLALILTLIFSIVFEALFFYLFILDINLIGIIDPLRPFSADFGYIMTILLSIAILVIFFTGLKFTRTSLRSENEEVRLKGKFLLLAFITFAIAGLLEKIARSILIGTVFTDPTIPILSVMLVVVRLLLIISALAFYGGFLLPNWMKKILTK